MTDAATVAAAQPTRIVPTISQPVRISWNDHAEQFLVHETTLIENAAEAGFEVILPAVLPMGIGGMLARMIGPTVVKEVVDRGLVVLEGLLSNPNLAITVDPKNFLLTYVANTLNELAPNLVLKLEALLDPMIAAAVAKVMPASDTTASPVPGDQSLAPHIQTGR